jgi:GT2 family glycosyltransferase
VNVPLSVSIVLVTYNSAAVVGDALESWARFLPEAETVVVDNGSRDNTLAIVERRGVDRVVSGHGNVGFGAGVNRGARVANGSLLLVANPDVVATAVDRDELRLLADREPVGIRGCIDARSPRALLPRRWGVRAELLWGLTTWFLVPRELHLQRPRWGRRGSRARWVPGSAFIVSREEFLVVGGFDEQLFLYFEDVDLSRRYEDRGLPIGATRAASVTHSPHSSSPREEELMTACALLSLFQYTATWEGRSKADRLAALAMRLLAALQRLGVLTARVPRLGTRAARKSASAEAVRRLLLASGADGIPPGAYADARSALALAERRRSAHSGAHQ